MPSNENTAVSNNSVRNLRHNHCAEKGIYYEEARKRYRIRLYKGGRVVFRKYVKTYEEAQKIWRKALKKRAKMPVAADAVPVQPTPLNILGSLSDEN